MQNAKIDPDGPYQPLQNSNPYMPQSQYPSPLPPAADPYGQPFQPSQPTMNQNSYNSNEQFAEESNHLRAQKSSMHCQALIGNLIFIGGLVTAVVLFITDKSTSVGVFAGILVGSYVIYLIVACSCNRLGSYLGNIDRGQNFQHYYEWLRNGVGHFQFNAECYHYQTRHHTRHVRDANGNNRTEHYTTTEKVVTHRATENLTPIQTKDESGPVDQIRAEKNIVFIHFFIRHKFSNYQSQINFENFFIGFKMRHTRDSQQDFTFRYQLPGLVERKAFFVGEMECNMKSWYYTCGLLGLLWPYSLWVEGKISRFNVETIKVLTI